MNATAERLLRLLADGELHSGAKLAAGLGVTRAAVWKTVADLRERRIEVLSHERRGYRLPRPVELLDGASIRSAARAVDIDWPAATEIHFEIGSTNEYLHAAAPPVPGSPRLAFAELQTAGRGRRGRQWIAPFGSGLTYSIAWTFSDMPADLSALSLAMGVCVVRGLHELGATTVQLKWPNDIVCGGRKLGGLLSQMRAEAGGPACVVVGLGLNLQLPAAARAALVAPGAVAVTDLAEACPDAPPARNVVAGVTAARMLEGLALFAQAGFAPFAASWSGYDSLRDAAVTVLRHDGVLDGIARGADPEGALLVETAQGRIERLHAGDVSLRPAAASLAGRVA